MNPLAFFSAFLHLCAVLPLPVEIGFPGGNHAHYRWVRAIESGNGRDEQHWKEGTWPLHLPIVVRGSSVLMVGERHTWISTDGIHWSRHNHDGTFGKRYGAALIFRSGRFWMFGGMKTWEKFENDIWSSGDGLHWTLELQQAPWSPRRGHAVLEHDGKLWLIGGAESSGKPNVLPNRSLGDVWVSGDGITWTRLLVNAEWDRTFPKSYLSTAAVAQTFRNRLWILGAPETNTVWSSEDGARWERQDHPRWPPREGRVSAVFDGKIWLFGGNRRNDAWFSEDGIRWSLLAERAPWSQRSPWAAVVFQNKLWIYGGKTGRSADRGDDVWFLERAQPGNGGNPYRDSWNFFRLKGFHSSGQFLYIR